MLPTLGFQTKEMRVSEKGEESGLPDLMGGVNVQNQERFYLGEEEEIYEAYGKRKTVYPYKVYDAYQRQLKMQNIRVAVLENSFLKAEFLPDYGGRLWSLMDKKSGRNLLYTNDVIRPSNLAVRNAWFSGGVEWNIGVIGHTPLTMDSLYMAELQREDGIPILRFYEYERIRKVIYQMDFWLEEKEEFLNARIRIVNPSNQVIPMYWWSNMAVPEYQGGRIVVPADSAFTYVPVDQSVQKTEFPIIHKKDHSFYENVPSPTDYFFDIPKQERKYIAQIDKNGFGLLHLSTARLQSRKLFTWGNGKQSDCWQEFLTDKAGRYIEIQAGLAKTQYGCLPMAPHTAWEWLEQYGAVKIPEKFVQADYKEIKTYIGKIVKQKMDQMQTNRRLKDTKTFALTQGKLVSKGSGYGSFDLELKQEKGEKVEDFRPFYAHLNFVHSQEDKNLAEWRQLLYKKSFPCPPITKKPVAYMDDYDIHKRLKETVKGREQKNWYAHYHLAVQYFHQERYKKSEKHMKLSMELEKNPWAAYGMALLKYRKNNKKKAVFYCKKGLCLCGEDLSYWKGIGKILLLCDGEKVYQKFYDKLRLEWQQEGRLRFYYLTALERLGEKEKAYQLLMESGGLCMADIREGEDSIGELWQRLYHEVIGGKEELPVYFAFKE